MKRKLISAILCTCLTFTSMWSGCVWADSSSGTELMEAATGTSYAEKDGSNIVLNMTDSTKWSQVTDSDSGRTYLEGVDGAELTTSISGEGWLIFDWMITNGTWQEKFSLNKAGSTWPVKEISASSSSSNDWQTQVVHIDSPAELSWKASTAVGGAKARIDNIRFTSSKTKVNCSITGVGSVSVNGTDASENVMAEPGSNVTVTASETGGDIFKAWKDASGNVLSNSTSYSFKIYDDTVDLTAEFVSVFDGSGTAEDPYKISTSEDLNKINESCAGGNPLNGKEFKLQDDINVGADFKGIQGTFNGVFNGNGKKISGIQGTMRGLFEKTGQGSVIKDLTVSADIVAPDQLTGIIAGSASGDIINCAVSGSINSAYKNVGGIAGRCEAKISDCSFDGKIISTYSGGYIGTNVGGIAGSSIYSAKIENCISSGSISGNIDYLADAGGIVGSQGSDVEECVSMMDITGYQRLGGIVGTAGPKNIKNCYSKGTVTAQNGYTGGIAGNVENDEVNISGCYSTAEIISTNGAAGGIVGYGKGPMKISDSVALNKSVEGNTAGRIMGQAEKNWKNASATLTNNYAFAALSMKANGAEYIPADEEKGSASVNGQDIAGDTLKDSSTAAGCFSGWDSSIWDITAGKLPVLKTVVKGAQSAELPAYITGGGAVEPDPGDKPSGDKEDTPTEELKAALIAEGETELNVIAVKNLSAADGNTIVVHKGGNSTYPEDVYAGGEGKIARTINNAPVDGEDTSEGSFTVEWTGSGYLLFDHFVLSQRGADKYMISVDGGEAKAFTSEGLSLYSKWKTAVYHVDGDADQKHTAKVAYVRSKWGADNDQCVLFDKVRFVQDAEAAVSVSAIMPDGAETAGCRVNSVPSDISAVRPGTDVKLEAVVPEGSGWVFNGWKNSADSEKYLSNNISYDVKVLDSDISVYADFEKPFDGNGTEASPYLINNYDDIEKISKMVNSGTRFAGYYFRQTADIDMSGKEWQPIGSTDKSVENVSFVTREFCGSYDGNGKTISNMTAVSEIEAGLFGRTDAGSSLKNITIINSEARATITASENTNRSYVGMIVGLGESNISNCKIKNCKATGIMNVGGIVGASSYMGDGDAVIENCGVENTEILATGVWDNAYAAGIVGTATSTIVKNCYFTGDIKGYGRYVGGITGKSFRDISGCYVKSDITSYASETSNIDANAVGGIAATYSGGTISDCYVVGNITGGRSNVGGIIGKMTGSAKIADCYVVGNITGNEDTTGGMAGSSAKASADDKDPAAITNSVYIGEKISVNTEKQTVGRITGSNDAKKPADLAGNYAYEGTVLSAAGKTIAVENKGLVTANGADITRSQLNAAATAPAFAEWNRDMWSIVSGKLPVLKNIEASVQSGELPAYIKESSSGGGSGSSGGGSGSSGGTTVPSKPSTVQDTQTPSAGGESKSFNDVKTGSWYAEAVKKVTEKGIMNGVSSNQFAPEKTVSRAMFGQILYNMENKPSVSGNSVFKDIANSAWYSSAVSWANANGIVKGLNADTFGPDNDVTREQFAVMLYRYAIYKGLAATETSENISGFADRDDVSEYAVQALNWAVGKGIITGKKGNKLDPKGSTTRAEAAAMITRFVK